MPKKKEEETMGNAVKAKEEKEIDSVTVPKSQLDDIQNTIKDQAEELAVLKGSVSRSRYEQAETKFGKSGEDIRPRGFLKYLHGALIVGWKSAEESPIVAENKIIFSNNQPVGEVMKGEYIPIDEKAKTIVCDYVDFVRSNEQEFFRIKEVNGDMLIIEFENKELPQTYSINSKFINP